jgi:hypothetical protein
MIGGTAKLELGEELDHPARRCSNAYLCRTITNKDLLRYASQVVRTMDRAHIMVVSEVALVKEEGHGVDGGGRLQKEARLRQTIGETRASSD